MTVICYRDGVMAADSSGWMGDICATFGEEKVRSAVGGGLAAATGTCSRIELFHDWLNRGAPKDAKPFADVEEGQFGALHVLGNGAVLHYNHALESYVSTAPYAVEGSHEEFLLALMVSGHSAIDAVALAIKHCAYAAGRVQSRCLHAPPNPKHWATHEEAERALAAE